MCFNTTPSFLLTELARFIDDLFDEHSTLPISPSPSTSSAAVNGNWSWDVRKCEANRNFVGSSVKTFAKSPKSLRHSTPDLAEPQAWHQITIHHIGFDIAFSEPSCKDEISYCTFWKKI